MTLRLEVEGRLRPRRRDVFADALIGRVRRKGRILLPDDTIVREWNIKDRWFRVHAVGSEIDWLRPGEWVLVRHGRWSQGWKMIDPETGEPYEVFRLDPEGIMLAGDEPLTDEQPVRGFAAPDPEERT